MLKHKRSWKHRKNFVRSDKNNYVNNGNFLKSKFDFFSWICFIISFHSNTQKEKFAKQKTEYEEITRAQHKLVMETVKGRNEARRKAQGSDDKNGETAPQVLERELARLHRKQALLQASIDRYKVYKDFMEQVEERNGDGSTAEDIMNRYGTLKNSYETISAQMNELRAEKDQVVREHADQKTVCSSYFFILLNYYNIYLYLCVCSVHKVCSCS